MKSSIYNIYFPIVDNKFILLNTLSGSFLYIDDELKYCLEGGKESLKSLEDKTLSDLMRQGVVIEDDVDELKIFRFKYMTRIYSTVESSFIIYPTYSCNLSCHYCYESALNLPKKGMNYDIAGRVIEFIKRMTIENNSNRINLGFYGGEPLLEHEICTKVSKEIFEWSNDQKLMYYGTLTTNGSLFTEEVMRDIGTYISSIQITLDGSKETHDKTRFYSNGTGTYDKIMTAVEYFLNKGIHVSLRLHVDDNPEDIEKLLLDLSNRNFNTYPKMHLYFSLIAPSNSCLHFHENVYITDNEKKS